MKKIVKNKIFITILLLIIGISSGVGATLLYDANQILYTPEDTTWNVNDVESALNNLYSDSVANNKGPVKIINYGFTKRDTDSRCNYAESNVIVTTIPEDGKYTLIVSDTGYVYYGAKYYVDSTSTSVKPGKNHIILDLNAGQVLRVVAVAGFSGGDSTVSNCYANVYGILLQGEVENSLITS